MSELSFAAAGLDGRQASRSRSRSLLPMCLCCASAAARWLHPVDFNVFNLCSDLVSRCVFQDRSGCSKAKSANRGYFTTSTFEADGVTFSRCTIGEAAGLCGSRSGKTEPLFAFEPTNLLRISGTVRLGGRCHCDSMSVCSTPGSCARVRLHFVLDYLRPLL